MKTFVLSISLYTGCYRHIKISSDATLFDLHEFILKIFDFADDHLHAFFMNNRAWDSSMAYYSYTENNSSRLTTDYRLRDFGLEKGSKFLYIFDFGDEWRFNIKVLRIEEEEIKKPILIKSVGDSPEQYQYDDEYEEYDDILENKTFLKYNPLVSADDFSSEEQKTVSLLNKYAAAAINLYGVISKSEFVDIYNSQNAKKISVDDLCKMLSFYVYRDRDYCFYKEYLVFFDFIDNDFEDVADILAESKGKPRYVPSKNEFLKYSDDSYNDNYKYAMRLYTFLEKHFGKNRQSFNLYRFIFAACYGYSDTDGIFAYMQENNMMFDSLEDMNTFAQLYTDVQNNTRQWENKGYTPRELFYIYEKNKRDIPKPTKIGRNDPCPCGSGKKYKKCCGK